MVNIAESAQNQPISSLCPALGISRAAFYRQQNPSPKPVEKTPRKPNPNALSPEERENVIKILDQERFMDKAPRQVYNTLLDEGIYLCSVGTMYRILEENGQLKERRNITIHRNYKKPELLATAPKQLWSWDITKLLGPQKWTYYYLYVILDVFSRYVVGWMIAPFEKAGLATELIAATCEKQAVPPGQLTIHADRGSAMKSKPVAFLLADLGVTKTHSRPHVSNDNPFSESQFKTMKYQPAFPERFGSIEDARAFCQDFFAWYNNDHYHSGIAYLTPETVHYGKAAECLKKRSDVLEKAHQAHPERFPKGPSIPRPVPEAVWINPPETSKKGDAL